MSDKKDEEDKKNGYKKYLRFSGIAFQMGITILIGALGGQKLDSLQENGLDVMVVQLPDKYDPDDVIKAYGREGYQKILDESLPLVEFKLKYLKSKNDLTNVDGRVKFLDEAIGVLVSLSRVERELYTPLVSELSSTNIDFIKREIDKKLEGKSIDEDIKASLTRSNVVTKMEVDYNDEENSNQEL